MIKEFLQRLGSKKNFESGLPLDIHKVEKIIDYAFQDKNLLIQALKHRSFLALNKEDPIQSNERLEFLGDAVLDLIVTDHLCSAFPHDSEGNLSKKKSVLVSRQVLGGLSEALGLGSFLLINKGEEKTGGRKRSSNLANLFEAILGAIYLDGGYQKAMQFVNRYLLQKQDEFLARTIYFNYKSILLEYSQAKGWGIPLYEIIEEQGPDHEKKFKVVVKVGNFWQAKGVGRSKKKAEQMAAKNVMQKIKAGKVQEKLEFSKS